MDTFVGLLIIIAMIIFWGRLKDGIIGALILGLIGGIFGTTGAEIGLVLGFFIGVSSQDSSEEEVDEGQKFSKTGKSSAKSSHKPDASKKTKPQIIRCPSCKKKIRVKLPLRAKNGKCVACSCSFSLKMDENGNLKADKISAEDSSKSNPEAIVLYYFKVLGVERTATPQEVRMAYKRKIREYHPDRVEGLGDKLKEMADKESKEINVAYTALKAKGLSS